MNKIHLIVVFVGVSAVLSIHPQSKATPTNDYVEKLWGDTHVPSQAINGFAAGIYAPISDTYKGVSTAAEYAWDQTNKLVLIPFANELSRHFRDARDAIAKLPEAQRLGIVAGGYAMIALTAYIAYVFYQRHEKTVRYWKPKTRTFYGLIALAQIIPFSYSLLTSASATASLPFWKGSCTTLVAISVPLAYALLTRARAIHPSSVHSERVVYEAGENSLRIESVHETGERQ